MAQPEIAPNSMVPAMSVRAGDPGTRLALACSSMKSTSRTAIPPEFMMTPTG